MISLSIFSEIPANDLQNFILWLSDIQPPPLHLFRNENHPGWSEFRRQRLFPLMYTRFQEEGLLGSLPPVWVELLKHDYWLALKRSLDQEAEIKQLLRMIEDYGVEVMLLKGAALRLLIYRDPATRPMSDLDLLVSPQSLTDFLYFLEDLGYSEAKDGVTPNPGFRQRYRVALHLAAPPPASIMLDLHWGLEGVANYYRLPFDRLALQARSLDWEGLPVRVLSPEHTLIHLCLHHFDEKNDLLGLLDLELSLAYLHLDWQVFLMETFHCHCQAPILAMLRNLAGLFPGTVPLQVLRDLEANPPRLAERLILHHSHNALLRLLSPLVHQPRPSDWLAYLAALLWPAPEYLSDENGRSSRLKYLASSFRHLFSARNGGSRR